jgi:hypothetical protein
MLQKTEWAIKYEQSRNTGNTEQRQTKKKHNIENMSNIHPTKHR